MTMSSIWNLFAPSFADHLWQSTLFAGATGLLALVLRKNSARLRYSLWLAASLKFLVPFSLFFALGGVFTWRTMPPATSAGMYSVEIVSQPFTKSLSLPATAAIPSPSPVIWARFMPFLLSIWLMGFVVVLSLWMVRWLRVSAMIRRATSLSEGREFTALRRLEHLTKCTRPINLWLSRASLEPGVFGIFRPVLLWPRSISERLEDAHLEAIMAHELCHVRRRDNLAAALHMLVEAIFWFHPLVWWIGLRLIVERERACDEAVLELGSRRQIYAESILKVCEFCLSSPLSCVAGVTGADLKKRMVHIMNDHVVLKLNLPRKVLLWTAGCLAIALPIAFGMFSVPSAPAQAPAASALEFATVELKPHPAEEIGKKPTLFNFGLKDGELQAKGVTLKMLMGVAYHVQDAQLVGAPEWFNTERYDIIARADQAGLEKLARLGPDQQKVATQSMVQRLLAAQFKLALHQEVRDLPVYELVVADGGAKLQKTSNFGFLQMGRGELTSQGTPVALLNTQLALRLGRTVLDKTGLTGNFAYSLRYTPDADEEARLHANGLPEPKDGQASPASSYAAPPLFTAIQEQLGLKLEPKTDRVPVLVIDHVEQPSAVE
jgi:bla regulator protein blaR1